MAQAKRTLRQQTSHLRVATQQPVSSLARGLQILRCFERGERLLGNQEIASRTGLPKATVSRLTFTLASLGLLTHSPNVEKYSLGVGVLALGRAYLLGNDIMAIARPLMQSLADYTKSAVMLGTSDGSHMVLLDIAQGDELFRLKLEAGSKVPHGSTALGRAYLAALPDETFEQYLAELEEDCAPEQWKKLRSGLVHARQDFDQYGFCFSLGDWHPDLFAVGVPLASRDGSRLFALNCSGRVGIATRESLIADFGPRLVALRNSILEMLGDWL